jgi:hypothetical protein
MTQYLFIDDNKGNIYGDLTDKIKNNITYAKKASKWRKVEDTPANFDLELARSSLAMQKRNLAFDSKNKYYAEQVDKFQNLFDKKKLSQTIQQSHLF